MCAFVGCDRTSIRCQPPRPDDAVLRERLKALAQEWSRFGYRRLHVLLRREGHTAERWAQAGLSLKILISEIFQF